MKKRMLDTFIDSNRDAMINDIVELVSIESITGNKKENDAALDFVLNKARAFGMRTGVTSAHDAAYVEIGKGDKTVGVLVHVDVVDVGDLSKWRFHPFDARVADGFIWGRGSVDDKGAVIMTLYAMRAILESGCELEKRIRLIIGTSEESDWTDMESYISEFGMPDYGFSPDGDFPIFNAEKGYADVLLSFTEPLLNEINALSSGDSPNTIPSYADIEWQNGVRNEFQGVAAHSSEPSEGKNAICIMAAALSDKKLNFVRFLNDFIENDDLCPRLNIDDGDEYIGREKVGRTTAVPTVLRLTDRGVELNLNIRQKYGVTSDDIMASINGFGEDYGFTAKIRPGYLSGMMVSSDSEHLQLMKHVYEEYGYKAEFMAAAGTSYAKAMPNFVSWGPIFCTDPNCFHQENERLSLNTMVVAAKMYACYLYRTASQEEKSADTEKTTSLKKALSLLNIFMEAPYVFSLAQIVSLSRMNRTTVYRNLTALEEYGILIRDEITKAYSLGPLAFRLGNVYLRSAKCSERILVILEKIAAEVKESVGLARREGNSVISIYSVESHQPVKMNDLPGEFYPMNKGTYGKCLMAYYDQETVKALLKKSRFDKTCPNTLTKPDEILAEYQNIRKNGFVLSIEETAPLIIGVGVPIKDSSGGVRNVVAVSFLKHGDYLEKIESIKAVLFRYQKQIEECL